MKQQNAVERFIPYRNTEIVDMICADGWLDEVARPQFRSFCTILESLYHFEFHAKVKSLKNYYHPFDPDQDTHTNKIYSQEALRDCESNLITTLTEVLNDANYEILTEQNIQYAMHEETLFPINLEIDFADFANYMIHRRGDVIQNVSFPKWLWWQEEIPVPTFERVIILIKFKNADYFAAKGRKNLPFAPNSMVIKLFKNIPKADLKMLFPNAKLKMRLNDRLLMGIPAIGGAVGIIMKTGAGLLAFFVVLYALIKHMIHGSGFTMPGPAEFAQIITGITAISAIVGFVFQQWAKYKNRKIEFLKMLGDNLYFRNLDNNGGVFHHLIDAAEEEECKEAILGYYFLLKHPQGLTEKDLDQAVEHWFANKYQTHIDFEVDDALRKLKALDLCTVGANDTYYAISMSDACRRIDEIWDNYFQYNV